MQEIIAAIPTPKEEIPTEEDKVIENAIKNVEKIHNEINKTKNMFRVVAEVFNNNRKVCATIDASLRINTNPNKSDIEREAILVSFLIKGRKIKTRTSVVKDIDLEQFEGIEVTTDDTTRDTSGPEAGSSTMTTEDYYQGPTEEVETTEQTHPEKTMETGLIEKESEISRDEEKTKKSKK